MYSLISSCASVVGGVQYVASWLPESRQFYDQTGSPSNEVQLELVPHDNALLRFEDEDEGRGRIVAGQTPRLRYTT
jgi:hypothetical protein